MLSKLTVLKTLAVFALLLLVSAAASAAVKKVQAITAPIPQAGMNFGKFMAVSGDTLAVALPDATVDSVPGAGLVYIYRRGGSGWAYETTLTAPINQTDAGYGSAIAVVGDTVLVGAGNYDVAALVNAGTIWVYTRNVTLSLAYTLTDQTPQAEETFGRVIEAEQAEDGILLVTHTFGDWQQEDPFDSGEVLFYRIPADSAPLYEQTVEGVYHNFGETIQMHDGMVVFATTGGHFYTYQRIGGTWTSIGEFNVSNLGGPLDLYKGQMIGIKDLALWQGYDAVTGAFERGFSKYLNEAFTCNPANMKSGNGFLVIGAPCDASPFAELHSGAVIVLREMASQSHPGETVFGPETVIMNASTQAGTKFGFSSVVGDGEIFISAPGQTISGLANAGQIVVYDYLTTDESILLNGGFEDNYAVRGISPAPWVVKSASADKIKCAAGFGADGSPCAFAFKGGKGEKTKLTLTLTGDNVPFFESYVDDWVFEMRYKTTMKKPKLKVKITFTSKFEVPVVWSPVLVFSKSADAYVLTGTTPYKPDLPSYYLKVLTIKVEIQHKTTAGKLYIDDIKLRVVPTIPIPARGPSALPLPPLPLPRF